LASTVTPPSVPQRTWRGSDPRTPPAIVAGRRTKLGWRYVYNVLSDREPATLAAQALRFAGNTSSGPGYICSGAVAATLTQYGLVPLILGPDPNNPTLATSACRLEPNPNTP
jgi:hypothetical protein